jgi:ribonuclease D
MLLAVPAGAQSYPTYDRPDEMAQRYNEENQRAWDREQAEMRRQEDQERVERQLDQLREDEARQRQLAPWFRR